MTERRTIRVRARRNKNGTVLEWHPEDRDDALELVDEDYLIIKRLYGALDRRFIADCDLVAEVTVWPSSGEIETIDVETDLVKSDVAVALLDKVQNGGGVRA